MNQRDQLLFVLASADMGVTTDQTFTKLMVGTNYVITGVIFRRTSGAFNTACAGGIYTAATKGGTALVAAGQSYANLTGANKLVIVNTVTNSANFATANTTDAQTATPILSLTTANTGGTGTLVASIGIFGYVVD